MNDPNSSTHTFSRISSMLPNQFVRRCCAVYLFALIGFWSVAVGQSYLRAQRRHTTFSVKSLFFRGGDDRFRDFTNFDPSTGRFSAEYIAPALPYFPAAEGMFLVFVRVLGLRLQEFLLFICVSAVTAALFLIRALSRDRENGRLLTAVVATSLILSYPMMFLLERANLEGFIWPIWAVGLVAFAARYHKSAAVLFALVAAMKLYPGVMLLLLFSRKRYKELGLAIAAFAVFTLIGLQLLGPSIPAAIEDVRANSARIAASQVEYNPESIGYEHSLFAVIKQVAFFLNGRDNNAALAGTILAVAKPYVLLVLCVLPLLYWLRIRKLPLLNQATALIIVAVTFPHVSGEYTLNHLYFPWALFLLFLSRDVGTGKASISWPAARGIMLCFAFLFALGQFGMIAGQLKTGALLMLLLIVLTVPMRSSLLEDDTEPAGLEAQVSTPVIAANIYQG